LLLDLAQGDAQQPLLFFFVHALAPQTPESVKRFIVSHGTPPRDLSHNDIVLLRLPLSSKFSTD